MTPASSKLVKTIALASACAVHGAVLWSWFGKTETLLVGSTASMEASVGNSFADMTQGTVSAEETEEITEAVTPDMTSATEPVDMADTPEPTEIIEPVPTPTPVMEAPEEAQKMEVTDAPLPSVVSVPAETPQVTSAQKPPVPPPEATQPDVTERIKAQDKRIVTKSLRPKPRSPEFEKRVTPKKKVAQAKPEKPRSQPRGDAQQNAQTGTDSGTSAQKQQVASVGSSRAPEVGNAAASNYPGKVMKKISRVPKPRVGTKGTSVVAFTISSAGGLSAISLARSSGSPRLDQAALHVVRKAAPFPPPPAGARRSFSIKIKGR